MYLTLTAKSASLMRAVTVHVLLPYHDGYPDMPAPYPTLYFLPGFSSNAEEIMFALPMRQMSALYGTAIVIPDGENSFYADHPERAQNYATFVSQELPEITRHLLPCLSSDPAMTYIGGISMGGYGALIHGLNHPDRFSRMLLYSPAAEADLLLTTHPGTAGAVPAELMDTLLSGKAVYDASPALNPLLAADQCRTSGTVPPIWMCCGEEDTLVGPACEHFSAYLTGLGIAHDFVRGHGGHDLMYWDEHLEEGFRFLRGAPRF